MVRAEGSAVWVDGHDPESLPQPVRLAFPALAAPFEIRPLRGGLLHRSFHVRAGDVEYVLQRVSDVFSPAIHDNIQRVTAHLAARGLPVPRLEPTVDGEPSAALGRLGRWRLMRHLGGASFERLQSNEQAVSAGHLVGRFHAALRDFDAPLAPLGIRYRDTPGYLASLRRALDVHRDHRLASPVGALARGVLAAFEALGPPPDVPKRVIHGDLKLANLLFEGEAPPARDRAFAIVDLDTLMHGALWMELGDAWRSWCNPVGEDGGESRFELRSFEASARGFLEGYGERLPTEERRSLEQAPERLMLELCTRFLTDALDESYFGWDETRFSGRGEHNLARAEGQWRLFEATVGTRPARAALLEAMA